MMNDKERRKIIAVVVEINDLLKRQDYSLISEFLDDLVQMTVIRRKTKDRDSPTPELRL